MAMQIHSSSSDDTTHWILANSPVRGSDEWWAEVEHKLGGFSSFSSSEMMLKLADPDDMSITDELRDLVDDAWDGIRRGHAPALCEEGVGGTYFMRDNRGKKLAVYKPQDEEPFHVNNPKGYRPRRESNAGFKDGILVGEASVREVAAYLLDYNGFADVPPTTLCLCEHPAFHYDPKSTPRPTRVINPYAKAKVKLGSFQKFVKSDGDTEDISHSLLKRFPIQEVHKICVLDIRLCNTDRHGGNILYKEIEDDDGIRGISLIPIDHGYTIPSNLAEAFFTWLIWPQAKVPFDERTKQYIRDINVELDVHLLQEKFGRTLDNRHFRTLRICTLLLKMGAEANLTPHQIGELMSRTNLKEPCMLEKLVDEALELAHNTSDDRVLMPYLKTILSREITRVVASSHN